MLWFILANYSKLLQEERIHASSNHQLAKSKQSSLEEMGSSRKYYLLAGNVFIQWQFGIVSGIVQHYVLLLLLFSHRVIEDHKSAIPGS